MLVHYVTVRCTCSGSAAGVPLQVVRLEYSLTGDQGFKAPGLAGSPGRPFATGRPRACSGGLSSISSTIGSSLARYRRPPGAAISLDNIMLIGQFYGSLIRSVMTRAPTPSAQAPLDRGARVGITRTKFQKRVSVAFGFPRRMDSRCKLGWRDCAERGYVAGQKLKIEYRYSQAQTKRIPALVSDLVAFGPLRAQCGNLGPQHPVSSRFCQPLSEPRNDAGRRP
jgi:hypothetical protein